MDISFLKKIIDKSENCYIIVEGKKDKKILTELGFKNVYALYELGKILKDRKYYEALILTDNDYKGNKMYKKIKEILLSEDIVDNYNLRKKFFIKIRKMHIEDLEKNLENIKFYINILYGNIIN